jgi:hypothetical protein
VIGGNSPGDYQGDATHLERSAHDLRGEAGLFGAKIAYDLAVTLETMACEGHLDRASRILRILEELEQELERVISFFDHDGWETRVLSNREAVARWRYGCPSTCGA